MVEPRAAESRESCTKCKKGKREIACDTLYELVELANLHAWIELGDCKFERSLHACISLAFQS